MNTYHTVTNIPPFFQVNEPPFPLKAGKVNDMFTRLYQLFLEKFI